MKKISKYLAWAFGAALYFLITPDAWDTTFSYANGLCGADGIRQLEANGLSLKQYAMISTISAITYAPFINNTLNQKDVLIAAFSGSTELGTVTAEKLDLSSSSGAIRADRISVQSLKCSTFRLADRLRWRGGTCKVCGNLFQKRIESRNTVYACRRKRRRKTMLRLVERHIWQFFRACLFLSPRHACENNTVER